MPLLKVMLPIVLILFVVVSMYITYEKRKKAGIKGLKSALTSICFFTLVILKLEHILRNIFQYLKKYIDIYMSLNILF